MEQILKFPKEEIQLLQDVLKSHDEKDNQRIIFFKDKILEKMDFYRQHHPEVFLYLVEASFFEKKFFETILITDEYLKQNYESFDVYFYALASFIALKDIYQAVQMIRKSPMLSNESIKYYYSEESANYLNLHHLSKELYDMCGNCLVLVNFIMELSKETLLVSSPDESYFMFRSFDLINTLYEIGYEEKDMKIFEQVMKIIFDLDTE